MRVVDHMLVEHCIRIADNECWQLLEILFGLKVSLVKLFARGWKEHRVDLCLCPTILVVFDPNMLSVKCCS